MTIVLDNPKNFESVEEAREWMWQQLQALEQGFNSGREFLVLDERTEAPHKLINGMLAFASGVIIPNPSPPGPPVTGWDPLETGVVLGDNKGLYFYYNGTWQKVV